jgi:acyl dehydratase
LTAMPIDPRHVGRSYGPFRYAVGAQKIAEFAVAVAGGVPGLGFGAEAPGEAHPWFVDEQAARASPHGAVIAPPTFCVNFAMRPFAMACADPDLGIDLVRLLHGEQEFRYHDVVRAGDVLETVGEIAEIYRKGSLDFLVVKTATRNQAGKLVLEASWTAVVRN